MPARWILCGQADEYSDDDEMMRGRGKEEEDRGALPNEHELGPNKVVKGWRPWPVRRGCTGHRTWRCNAPGLTRGRVREPDPSSLHCPSLLRDRHDDLVDLHAILVLGEPGLVGPV